MTGFSEPHYLAAGLGPGKQVVDCEECLAVVLPENAAKHEQWHEALAGLLLRGAES